MHTINAEKEGNSILSSAQDQMLVTLRGHDLLQPRTNLRPPTRYSLQPYPQELLQSHLPIELNHKGHRLGTIRSKYQNRVGFLDDYPRLLCSGRDGGRTNSLSETESRFLVVFEVQRSEIRSKNPNKSRMKRITRTSDWTEQMRRRSLSPWVTYPDF